MAGGTGGHVYPALAIADALLNNGQPVVWLGTHRGLEARVVVAANIPIEWLSISGLRGKGVLSWLVAPFRLVFALIQAISIVHRLKPRLVIGMGGFVSGPGGVAAWLLRVPLIVHEQNAVAGLTNRVLARLGKRVLQGFDNAFEPAPKVVTVGNPVREEIRDIAEPTQRFANREGALRLLVIGGSQGALALNTTVPAMLALLPEDARPLVRHQAGPGTLELAQDAYSKAAVLGEVTAYIDDMAAALSWADCVVCRAGALTVAELINAGLGGVLVPFPAAVDDHQTANARALVDADAAIIVQQSELTPQSLRDALNALGSERAELLQRARNARSLRNQDSIAAVLAQCAAVLDDETLEVAA
ncbi:MAG: undecaprenyldiphospho-muramoylpentapeptide beta-N-acetylglucosaminyltransferase [Pseudomonadota bacterium]